MVKEFSDDLWKNIDKKINETEKKIIDFVRNEPEKAMLIAAGIGAIVVSGAKDVFKKKKEKKKSTRKKRKK